MRKRKADRDRLPGRKTPSPPTIGSNRSTTGEKAPKNRVGLFFRTMATAGTATYRIVAGEGSLTSHSRGRVTDD